jgi:hypothetical protein
MLLLKCLISITFEFQKSLNTQTHKKQINEQMFRTGVLLPYPTNYIKMRNLIPHARKHTNHQIHYLKPNSCTVFKIDIKIHIKTHSSKTLEIVCVRCATLHVSVNILDHLQGLFQLQCYLRFVVFVTTLSGHVAVLSVYVVAVCTSLLPVLTC